MQARTNLPRFLFVILVASLLNAQELPKGAKLVCAIDKQRILVVPCTKWANRSLPDADGRQVTTCIETNSHVEDEVKLRTFVENPANGEQSHKNLEGIYPSDTAALRACEAWKKNVRSRSAR